MMRRRRRSFLVFVLGAVFVASCASVLGLRDNTRRPFEHRAHVIAGVTCVDCHGPILTATSTTPTVLPTNESCLECHDKPHDPAPCRGCHGLPGTDDRVAMARYYLAYSHRQHLIPLSGNCARCHENVARANDSLLPTMATCLGCHEHRGEFAARDCDKCHVAMEEEHNRPASHVVHEANFVNRHGVAAAASADLCETCHTERDCASCHGATTAWLPDDFEVASPRALHSGAFMARHALEAANDPGSCMSCHAEETCRSCHASAGIASGSGFGSPHPANWVGLTANEHGLAARRDPLACAACHSGPGEMLCVGCHKVGAVGGNPHSPGFESSRRRTDRPCSLCHF
ncbi:MAG: hypothetical protein IPK13_25450 [Deltaproteobacteria bacterium]|nr:hypothetical protein [Deltaproteobacteria bacterium]